jgi:hypothetical protein
MLVPMASKASGRSKRAPAMTASVALYRFDFGDDADFDRAYADLLAACRDLGLPHQPRATPPLDKPSPFWAITDDDLPRLARRLGVKVRPRRSR